MVRTDHLQNWFRFDVETERPYRLEHIAPDRDKFPIRSKVLAASCWPQPMDRRRRGALFYRVILPGFTLANLGLGVFTLTSLRPAGWTSWLELGTGVFCCVIAGFLLGAGWSKAYWSSAMERQVSAWRRIADAMFRWIEETPVPVDSLKTLQRSLDETIGG